MKEIIINQDQENNIILAFVEDGKLVEKYEQTDGQKRIEGNIYLGKVQNILSGMQAAFIDIGEEKNTFIHIKDIVPKVSNETGNKNEQFAKYDIKNYLKMNMMVPVQVKRDSTDKKGARVSTHLSFVGRFIVLMPEVEFVTVSQKIEEKEERARLIGITKEVVDSIKKDENYGIIVRTSAEGKTKEQIEEDVTKTIKTYKDLKKKIVQKIEKGIDIPELIYKNGTLIQKILIDVMDQGIERVIVNTLEVHQEVKKVLEETGNIEKIQLMIQNDEELLERYGIKKQLEKTRERKIWLKCGGFITIDKTEALTAIDVNSGKYVGNKSLDQTIYTVNKEATIEIAKQLRLRDIGGIIIIDYIDMENKEDKKKILELLTQQLKLDRSKTQIVGFTQLDLLEMTRKHICSNE